MDVHYVVDLVQDFARNAYKDIYSIKMIVYNIALLLHIRMDLIAYLAIQIANPVLMVNLVVNVIIIHFT